MKDETKAEIAEWWGDTELPMKFALIWLSLIVLGVITLAIMFPVFGLFALGVATVITTIFCIAYVLTDY